MQLGETNSAFAITIIVVFVLKLVAGDYIDSCHAFFNFVGNGPYEDVDTQGITWTTNPPITGTEPCKKRGVLSMVAPSWAQSAEIALTFSEEATGWLFNFGDSPHNNGYGGDGNEQYSTMYDAEIYSQYKSLSIYPNENGNDNDKYQNSSAFNRWLIMKVQSAGFAAYSDKGLNYKAYSLNLLQFGDAINAHEGIWYLGINRIINPYDKSWTQGNRDGEGLCSVCIRWVAGQNLEPPTEFPSVPNPDDGGADATPAPQENCMETGTCKVCYDFNKLDHNSYTNNKQLGVEWTMYPDDRAGPCSARSVMKLVPPEGAMGVQISLTFTGTETGWVFNLGDSPHNNGYGQGGDDGHNAELTGRYQHLQVYENTLSSDGNLNIYSNMSAYSKWLVLKLRGGGVAAFSDTGLFYKEYNYYLLQFSQTNDWYLGLNRVVEPHDGSYPIGNRAGEGLCSVCIEWNKDGNLNDPMGGPTVPTGPDATAVQPGQARPGRDQETSDPNVENPDPNVVNPDPNVENPDLPTPKPAASNVGVKTASSPLFICVLLIFCHFMFRRVLSC